MNDESRDKLPKELRGRALIVNTASTGWRSCASLAPGSSPSANSPRSRTS